MLGQRSQAFDPVAVVRVQDPIDVAKLGVVDMPTHDPLHAAMPGLARDGRLEVADIADCSLDLELQVLGQRPVRQPQSREAS